MDSRSRKGRIMIFITKFTGIYCIIIRGTLLQIPNIEREVWWDGEKEIITVSAEECEKIEDGIRLIYPNYFKK